MFLGPTPHGKAAREKSRLRAALLVGFVFASHACKDAGAETKKENTVAAITSGTAGATSSVIPAAVARAAAAPRSGARPSVDKGGWTVDVSDDGLFHLRYAHTDVAEGKYVFWGKDWDWLGATVETVATGSGAMAAFDIRVPGLGLDIDLRVREEASADLTFTYTVKAARPLTGIVGGGIEFHLSTDSPPFAQGKAPELLPGGNGFSWEPLAAQQLSVVFNRRLPDVTFEGDGKSQIRCFLVGNKVQTGTQVYTMTLRPPPDATRRRSDSDRYGPKGGTDWQPGTVEWDAWPIDLGFLNDSDRPAGSRGRVRARGADLIFADGSQARFWGTNLTAYSLFHGTHAAVANQAKRIAALGYNLVRIHHHDSEWVSPNVFAAGDTTQRLDPDSLRRIDWWVKCLRDEGVYVWLDLRVGRTFRKGDGIPGFEELTRSEPLGRGFDFVNPRIEELQSKFAEQYLARVNAFTGRSYLDDPAVLGVLLTNEDDLTFHFGNMMLPDKGNPLHRRMLEALMEKTTPALKVSVREALKTWLPGPAKIALADLEARMFLRGIAHLRRLGFTGLVATTSYWGGESMASLPSLTVGDVVDVHSYGEADSLGQNPHTAPNFISTIAAASVGKPVFISEWNVQYPARDRFVAPLYLASIASLQGWDAPMLFAYSQDPVEPPDRVDEFSTMYDPAITALMPAAALLYRQRHVREGLKTYRVVIGGSDLYDRLPGASSSAAIRTLAEQSKLSIQLPDLPELPWDGLNTAASGTIGVTDLGHDFLPPVATRVVSDTGELARDWGTGIQTIDTFRSQAAAGWIGGTTIQLHDVRFQIRTPKATVVVTSLDGRSIATSRRMLLTVAAQAIASPGDKLPFLAQPVDGTVSIRSPKPLRFVPLSPRALPGRVEKLAPIAAVRTQGESTFEIPNRVATHWFLITRD